MFRRLAFENTAALFTLAAFITAATFYVTIAWRAIRMKQPQVARFANLPFETATPESIAPAPAGMTDGSDSRKSDAT
jgi:hypothetical protein